MLTPPADLPETALTEALRRGWDLTAASMNYRPVGWGSHHWAVTDPAGGQWFVTADELENKRLAASEPLAAGYARLRAALAAAGDLRACGRAFVVAPVLAGDGEPLARVNDRFGVAVYPLIAGESFEWGEFASPAHRLGVLSMVAAVHTAPAAARRRALADDYAIPLRDELEAACDAADQTPDAGRYAGPVALLVSQNAAAIQRLLARYDRLVAQARAQGGRAVLTHGEPHPGNTMLAAGDWLLIDWDTALVAPPERDLWDLDPGDGTILDAYAAATGVTPQPFLLELYRVRWDLADLAIDVSRFRRPHSGTAEDDESFGLLSSLVERIGG